jgi:hypothetical protein
LPGLPCPGAHRCDQLERVMRHRTLPHADSLPSRGRGFRGAASARAPGEYTGPGSSTQRPPGA